MGDGAGGYRATTVEKSPKIDSSFQRRRQQQYQHQQRHSVGSLGIDGRVKKQDYMIEHIKISKQQQRNGRAHYYLSRCVCASLSSLPSPPRSLYPYPHLACPIMSSGTVKHCITAELVAPADIFRTSSPFSGPRRRCKSLFGPR